MAEVPYRVDKPWGYELIWARTNRYVGKLLHVRAGHVLIPRMTTGRTRRCTCSGASWCSGPSRATRLEEGAFRAGETVHIPPKLIHQIEAVVDSDVLEASTPELDDLVRLQDLHGRAEACKIIPLAERGPGCVPIPIWCPSRCSRWRAGR